MYIETLNLLYFFSSASDFVEDRSEEEYEPSENSQDTMENSEHVLFKCEYCQIQFKEKPDLINHQEELHRAEKEEEAKVLEALHCKECDCKFKNKSIAYDHIRYYHKKMFLCGKCDTAFGRMSDLAKHLKIHRKLEARELPEYGRLICQYCQEEFDIKQELKNHQQELHPAEIDEVAKIIENLQCNVCDRQFKTKSIAHCHIRNVHKKNYLCVKCKKQFPLISDLTKHLKVHEKQEARELENQNSGDFKK